MAITAFHELGPAGDRTSAPTVLDWRWYYHIPSLGFWGLVVFPLVLVKENRALQAWLIVVPLLVILLAIRMITILLFLPPATAESFGMFLMSVATAWTTVWLLGPWLSGRHGAAALLSAATVMLAIGLLSYVGNFGVTYDENLLPLVVCYATAAFGLLVPMALSGRVCRRTCSPGRFMTWLLLWMVLTPMVGAFVLVVSLAVLAAVTEGVESLANSVVAVPFCMLGGGVAGGLLYLINLPFLVVAFRNRFHRERFYHALRLPVSSPLAPEPGNGNPFASNADQIVRG